MIDRLTGRPDSEPDDDKIINDNGNLELRYDALKNYVRLHSSNVIGVNNEYNGNPALSVSGLDGGQIKIHNPFSVDLDSSYTSLRRGARYDDKTDEEELIEKALERMREENKKDNKTEELEKQLKEMSSQLQVLREAKEKDRASKEAAGLEIIMRKLRAGAVDKWYCGKCRFPLEAFKEETGIELIKRYAEDFKNGKLKACPKYGAAHMNWFVIKEDGGMIRTVETNPASEFRLPPTL